MVIPPRGIRRTGSGSWIREQAGIQAGEMGVGGSRRVQRWPAGNGAVTVFPGPGARARSQWWCRVEREESRSERQNCKDRSWRSAFQEWGIGARPPFYLWNLSCISPALPGSSSCRSNAHAHSHPHRRIQPVVRAGTIRFLYSPPQSRNASSCCVARLASDRVADGAGSHERNRSCASKRPHPCELVE